MLSFFVHFTILHVVYREPETQQNARPFGSSIEHWQSCLDTWQCRCKSVLRSFSFLFVIMSQGSVLENRVERTFRSWLSKFRICEEFQALHELFCQKRVENINSRGRKKTFEKCAFALEFGIKWARDQLVFIWSKIGEGEHSRKYL